MLVPAAHGPRMRFPGEVRTTGERSHCCKLGCGKGSPEQSLAAPNRSPGRGGAGLCSGEPAPAHFRMRQKTGSCTSFLLGFPSTARSEQPAPFLAVSSRSWQNGILGQSARLPRTPPGSAECGWCSREPPPAALRAGTPTRPHGAGCSGHWGGDTRLWAGVW